MPTYRLPVIIILMTFILFYIPLSLVADEPHEIYIIQLHDEPLALHVAAQQSRNDINRRLNAHTPVSQAYRAYLHDQQIHFLQEATAHLNRHHPNSKTSQPLDVIYHYQTVFNGVAMQLSEWEARQIRSLPAVRSMVPVGEVSRLDIGPRRPLCMAMRDGGCQSFGLSPDAQVANLRYFQGSTHYAQVANLRYFQGSTHYRDYTHSAPSHAPIIGIIDTGIWPEHPSFVDDGSYPPPPETWAGECTPPNPAHPPDPNPTIERDYRCTNKVIGIQYFLDAYVTTQGGGYDGRFYSGRDDDGHGTHVASISAGNRDVEVAIRGNRLGTISGVAPDAQIASYKVLGQGHSANRADIVAAIDKAVADGVDILNISMQLETSNPWSLPETEALLAAHAAGVFVTTIAGNRTEDHTSVSTYGNIPWVTTVGASYPNTFYLSRITLASQAITTTHQLTGLLAVGGYSPLQNFTFINGTPNTDLPNTDTLNTDTPTTCIQPYAPNTFHAGQAILCPLAPDISIYNSVNAVRRGGGGAVIFYATEDLLGTDDTSLAPSFSEFFDIPVAVVLNLTTADTGIDELIAFVKQHMDGQDAHVTLNMSAVQPVFLPALADFIADFSARGPTLLSTDENGSPLNLLKPDLLAPGVNILAGTSPQTASDNSTHERFQILNGTSQAAPYVAGVAALLKHEHPNWTPAQLQSALMSTANAQDTAVTSAYPERQGATPFEQGAGVVDAAQSLRAGFVLDEQSDNFRAANPSLDGDATTLNLASLVNLRCVDTCTWTRTLQSTLDVAVDWRIEISAPIPIAVDPLQFTLVPSQPQTITVQADVTGQSYDSPIFGTITVTPTDDTVADDTVADDTVADDTLAVAHFPLVVQPTTANGPDTITIQTRRPQGAIALPPIELIAVDDLEIDTYLEVPEPDIFERSISPDPTPQNIYDLDNGGVDVILFDVPEGTQQLVIGILASTAPQLDLYVGLDADEDGLPTRSEALCFRASLSWQESCDFLLPGRYVTPGRYWILVQNVRGSGMETDTFTLGMAMRIEEVDLTQNRRLLHIDAPATHAGDSPLHLDLQWTLPPTTLPIWVDGKITLRDTTSEQVLHKIDLAVKREINDVYATVQPLDDTLNVLEPGDTLEHIIQIRPERYHQSSTPVTYTISALLPDGLTYVPESATLEPTRIVAHMVTWEAAFDSLFETIAFETTIDEAVALPATLTTAILHKIETAEFETNVSSVLTTSVRVPDVVFDITTSGPAQIETGQPITYTLTITNRSVGTATDIVVENMLPLGTVYLHSTDNSTFITEDKAIHFEVNQLSSHSTATVSFAVTPVVSLQTDETTQLSMTTRIQNRPTIIGGGDAEAGAWPWQVALVYADADDVFQGQFCAGSIVASEWILTAAQCVFQQDRPTTPLLPSQVDIVAETHELAATTEHQRISVGQIFVHEGYTIDNNTLPDATVYDHDIALLRLTTPLTFTDTVAPIQLITVTQSTLTQPNTFAMITGWGDISGNPNRPQYSPILQQATVPLVARTTCEAVYSDALTDAMLCAGFIEGGKDACQGDRGGPLMVLDEAGQWRQVGIASWGMGCAQPQQYGVYTAVSAFLTAGDATQGETEEDVGWIARTIATYVNDTYRVVDGEGHKAEGRVAAKTLVWPAKRYDLYFPLIHR
ncbi:MAG: trypsin-like serine protease [Chloroflexota bacterium]